MCVWSNSDEPELRFWNYLWVGVGHKKNPHEVWKVEVNVGSGPGVYGQLMRTDTVAAHACWHASTGSPLFFFFLV